MEGIDSELDGKEASFTIIALIPDTVLGIEDRGGIDPRSKKRIARNVGIRREEKRPRSQMESEER